MSVTLAPFAGTVVVVPKAPVIASAAASQAAPVQVASERTLRFAWQPAFHQGSAYTLNSDQDWHRIVLTQGVTEGQEYPVVIALHGQPRRGQLPRDYAFPQVVTRVVRELVLAKEIKPLVLVIPTFRFEGENWPQFRVAEFLVEVKKRLSAVGVGIRGVYAFGHSGAAGCGGGGLNTVADASPVAVGFFDTCVGAGFVSAARALDVKGVATLIMHSVETAGSRPRHAVEYDAAFDFGRVYAAMGLRPVSCPTVLPEVPLRQSPYKCASSSGATTLALLVDTGNGERAHEALVPVAARYFMRRYLSQ